MSETLKFKTFCLEMYKNKKGISGRDAVVLFNKYGVLAYLEKFYDELHSYGENYLVQDIDKFIANRAG